MTTLTALVKGQRESISKTKFPASTVALVEVPTNWCLLKQKNFFLLPRSLMAIGDGVQRSGVLVP